MLNKQQLSNRVNYLGATDLVKLVSPTIKGLTTLMNQKLDSNHSVKLKKSVGAFGNIIEDYILKLVNFESSDWVHKHSNFSFLEIHLDGWKDGVNLDSKQTINNLPAKLPKNYNLQGIIQNNFVNAKKTKFIMVKFEEEQKHQIMTCLEDNIINETFYDYKLNYVKEKKTIFDVTDVKIYDIDNDIELFKNLLVKAFMFWTCRSKIIKNLEMKDKYVLELYNDINNHDLINKIKPGIMRLWNSGYIIEKGGKTNVIKYKPIVL